MIARRALNVETDQSFSKIDEILQLLEQVLDKANTAEKQLDSIEKQLGDKEDSSVFKKLEIRLKKIEDKVSKTRGKIEPSCALSESAKGGHKDLIDVNMNEIQDRDRRKNNYIIIFNVGECTSDITEVRKEYDMAEVT